MGVHSKSTILKIHEAKKPVKIHNPVVLITGDGWSLPEDLKNFDLFHVEHDIYCIGRSINFEGIKENVIHWGDIDSGESYYFAEHLPDKGIDGAILRHTLGESRGFDVDWDVVECPWAMDEVLWHGSSSLFGVLTALSMGYSRIVLAGCPMDSKPHWHTPNHLGPDWTGKTYQAWFELAGTVDGVNKVRSLSGYTETLLGSPTFRFLNYKSPNVEQQQIITENK